MKKEKPYIIGTNGYSFKRGERGTIVGVKWVKPSEILDWRLCYMVLFDDGTIDYTPINDGQTHKVIREIIDESPLTIR